MIFTKYPIQQLNPNPDDIKYLFSHKLRNKKNGRYCGHITLLLNDVLRRLFIINIVSNNTNAEYKIDYFTITDIIDRYIMKNKIEKYDLTFHFIIMVLLDDINIKF